MLTHTVIHLQRTEGGFSLQIQFRERFFGCQNSLSVFYSLCFRKSKDSKMSSVAPYPPDINMLLGLYSSSLAYTLKSNFSLSLAKHLSCTAFLPPISSSILPEPMARPSLLMHVEHVSIVQTHITLLKIADMMPRFYTDICPVKLWGNVHNMSNVTSRTFSYYKIRYLRFLISNAISASDIISSPMCVITILHFLFRSFCVQFSFPKLLQNRKQKNFTPQRTKTQQC